MFEWDQLYTSVHHNKDYIMAKLTEFPCPEWGQGWCADISLRVRMAPNSFIHTRMKREHVGPVTISWHSDLIHMAVAEPATSSLLINITQNYCITSIFTLKLLSRTFDIRIFNKHTFFTFNQYENTFTTTTMSIPTSPIECKPKQYHNNIIIFLF